MVNLITNCGHRRPMSGALPKAEVRQTWPHLRTTHLLPGRVPASQSIQGQSGLGVTETAGRTAGETPALRTVTRKGQSEHIQPQTSDVTPIIQELMATLKPSFQLAGAAHPCHPTERLTQNSPNSRRRKTGQEKTDAFTIEYTAPDNNRIRTGSRAFGGKCGLAKFLTLAV